MLTQRAEVTRLHNEAFREAHKGKPLAERRAAAKASAEELKHLLSEQWHYRLFDEVDETTKELLPALGKMHCVPQPTKAATSAAELFNHYLTAAISFGFSTRAWAHGAAMHADAFLDSHKRKTLSWFNALGWVAAALTIVMEAYGFYIIARTMDNPSSATCDAAVVSQCTVAACLRQACTLRNGYIPAPN